jgi:cell division protein ZapE
LAAETIKTVTLNVQGRDLKLRASGRIAIAEFHELCGENRGNADYIAVAENFDVLFLENIPQMEEDMRNEARRFINLIDILYEHKTMLVVSAAKEPDLLYHGSTAGFEFARTISRLTEMRGWKRRETEERLD